MMRFLTVPLGIALMAAGCTVIPNSGPTSSEILSQANTTTNRRYEVVEITPAVVDILKRRPVNSFYASFGDHRPSVEPVIGIGDFVAVTIWEAGPGGLFSAPLISDRFTTGSKSATIPDQVVARDGAITIPYAGRVRVANQTPQEVQRVIEEQLAGKAIQPQVLVTVTRPISNTATVTGEVGSGARVPLSVRGDRLLDVVATAGSVRAPVNETFVRLSRGSVTATVPMTAVVSNPRENIFIRPGDVVTLVREPQTFMAYGATGRNAEIPFDADGITLAQALAKAGGLLDFRADPAGVFIFRFEPASVVRQLRPEVAAAGGFVPVVYRLDMTDASSLFTAQAMRIQNRDVLYVTNAPMADVGKVLAVFNTVTAPLGSAASVYAYTK
jgi:polysaccharide export outer membrane protein